MLDSYLVMIALTLLAVSVVYFQTCTLVFRVLLRLQIIIFRFSYRHQTVGIYLLRFAKVGTLAFWSVKPLWWASDARRLLRTRRQRNAGYFRHFFEVDPVSGIAPIQQLVSMQLKVYAAEIEQRERQFETAWNRCHAQVSTNGLYRAYEELAKAEIERKYTHLGFNRAHQAARYFSYMTLPQWQDYLNPNLFPNTDYPELGVSQSEEVASATS